MYKTLARMFHELLSRDHEDGRATGQPPGVGSEAYLNGTSQGPTPEDARKNGHIRGRSKLFMKYPGSPCQLDHSNKETRQLPYQIGEQILEHQ